MRNNSSLNSRKSNSVNEKLCLIFKDKISAGLRFNFSRSWGISHLYKVLKDKWTKQWKMEDLLLYSREGVLICQNYFCFSKSQSKHIKLNVLRGKNPQMGSVKDGVKIYFLISHRNILLNSMRRGSRLLGAGKKR